MGSYIRIVRYLAVAELLLIIITITCYRMVKNGKYTIGLP